jgi:hypothetical protein
MVKATPILAAFCAAMPLTFQEATADDWVIEPTYGFFKEAAPTSGANPGAYFGALYYNKQTGVIYTCEAYFSNSLPNPQDNFNCYKVNVTETPTVPVTVVPGVRFFPTAPTPLALGGTATWASPQAVWITGSGGQALTICWALQGNVPPRCKQADVH